MKLTGSQIVIQVLKEQGVDTAFGYPGGTILNIFDALYQDNFSIRTVLTAHEQGASHAADGYARATGRTGVVLATSGPGATNLVTGLATAFMDSVPVVAITANVPSRLIGKDAFQEVSITGVTMPITKHNFLVKDIDHLADALRNAFRIAETGRKGPVLVDITKDVTAAVCEYTPAGPMALPPLPRASDEEIRKIADLLNRAKRPVLYVGGGTAVGEGDKPLAQLMEKGDIPAAYTLMAAGVVDSDNPRNLGLIGMHGTVAANRATADADLVLALGTRFSDRVAQNINKFADRATRIQVDIDRSEFNKNVLVDMSVVGDVEDTLSRLLPLVEPQRRPEWEQRIEAWKKLAPKQEGDETTLHPWQVMDVINQSVPKDTIFVTDVGQHQLWASQDLKHHHKRSFLTSGGLGTMGYGYGAAIGAQIGCPEKRVVHITGDGSFHMNLNEGCTAVSNDLPIITVIMDNRVLGMVYQWQSAFYGRRFSSTTPERKTDFVKLAEAFGAKGFRAATTGEFREAFQKAMGESGPVWIDCVIDREERVLPMIPPGDTVENIIVE